MKTLKNAYFLIFAITFLVSCGSGENTDVNNATDSTSTEVITTTTETTTSTPTTDVEDASGKVTDAVVKKACDCQESARQQDGTIDYPKVGECMGGKTKIEFVAELLGASATEKQRADAERALTDKMNVKCPRKK